MKLVLASNNAKKLAELRALLADIDIELWAQGELGIAEAEEPHFTFIENALAKARHAAAAAGGAAIADDSGLCVDALDGAPGVISAHFAAIEPMSGDREDYRRKQDRANNELLLQRLQDEVDRRAHFISTLVAVRQAADPQPLVAVGRWTGEILTALRGESGFGYDPLLFIPALGRTVAELDPATKNAHSHRALAMAQMKVLMHEVWQLWSEAVAHYLRPGTLQLSALPPLALYVHLPWCLKKCPYCDFNSHENKGEIPEQRYLDALRADLEAALPLVWGRRIVSVFIGGGTPSLFSPAGIDRLLADIRARLPLAPGIEITLEANPGTFERERFKAFRAAGVTRLSIGVQSFDDSALRSLGRVHDADQARAAVAEAREAFDTFNIDLMYALPGQTLQALQDDLDEALSYAPPHLSIYHLTIEPNTVFALRPPTALPDADSASDMLDLIAERTAAQGLQRYEVSAFARPGHRCAHNLNYWEFGDYLGIGAGAHGKLSFPHRVLRQVRWREPAAYMQHALAGHAVSNQHEVARRDLPFEYVLGALRLREGFALEDYRQRTGLPLSTLEPGLAQARQRGLIELDGAAGRVRPTARGYDFLSDLQAIFLPAAPST